MCTRFQSNLERKEIPNDLSLFHLVSSVRISFTLYTIRIISVLPLEMVVRMKVDKIKLWDRITGSTPKLLSDDLGDIRSQALDGEIAILMPKISV